jgi:hypothetical protein
LERVEDCLSFLDSGNTVCVVESFDIEAQVNV